MSHKPSAYQRTLVILILTRCRSKRFNGINKFPIWKKNHKIVAMKFLKTTEKQAEADCYSIFLVNLMT
jgi:hypothetical protein